MRAAGPPTHPRAAAWAHRAALLGLAALLLAALVGPLAMAVATKGTLTTFADGRASATLHFEGPCGANDTLALRMPSRANVTNASLTIARKPDSSNIRGVVRFDVGLDGRSDTAVTFTGDGTAPSNVTLDPSAFNSSLHGPNATGEETLVPLGIQTCSLAGGWNLTLASLSINYTLGSPSEAHAPVFHGPVPEISLASGATAAIDVGVASYFSDDDVDPLTYELIIRVPPQGGGSGVTIGFDLATSGLYNWNVSDGSNERTLVSLRWSPNRLAQVQAAAGWAGAVRFEIMATDPAGQWALSNEVSITVLAPDMPPVFRGPISDLYAVSGKATGGLLDASAYFADPNGLPLVYAIVDQDDSAWWPRVDLAVRGSHLDVVGAGDASWSGAVCFRLRATDVNGSASDSNRFCLHFDPPEAASPGGAGLQNVSITIVHPYPDPRQAVLTADPSPESGIEYEWWIDGVLVGRGESITVQLTEGPHTVRLLRWQGAVLLDGDDFTVDAGRAPPKPTPLPLYVQVGLLAGVGLLGLALLRLEVARFFLVGALIGALFQRLKGDSLLTHFTRGRLFQVISEHPGIRFNELKRLAQVSNGSAVHHLRVLHRSGYIRIGVEGTHTRFFATDARLDDDEYGLSEVDRDLLAAIQTAPGLSVAELASRIDRSASATSRAVSRLAKLGYLRRERNGKRAAVYLRLKPGPLPLLPGRPRAADEA